MRPLFLRLQAFGPFSGTQDLDFTRLGDNPLFLISGATGSGKTTILDAICFALYGDSSGKTREAREMRSDHAGPDTLTEVTFEFTLGDRVFRVHRIPEQERPKKTGEGFTTQKSDATLWERTGARGEEEGAVVASGWSKVTAAAQDLIGFSSDQFRQVIMLPQGKFRELLDAGSQDREAILEQLFPTEIYGKIQDALAERARSLKAELKRLEERKVNLLEHHGLEDEEGLERRLAEVEKEREGMTAQLEKAEQARATAQEALGQGRTLDGHFRERELAREQRKALEGRAPEMSEKEDRVKRAGSARGLSDLFRQLEKVRGEVRDAEATATTRTAALEEARTTFQEAAARLESEEGRKEERDTLAREISRLEGLVEKLEPLEKAGEALKECREAVDRARLEEKAQGEAVSGLEAKEAEAKTAREKAKEVAGHLGEMEGLVTDSHRRLQDRSSLADAAKEHAAKRESLADLERSEKDAVTKLDHATKAESAARSARERGQAAILARTLEPDAPCPVCGSTHHPAPATSHEAIPSEGEVESLKEAVEAARDERDRLGRELTRTHGEVDGMETRIADLRQRLGEDAGLALETLQERNREAEASRDAAREARDALPSLGDGHEKALHELEDARTALKKAEEARISAEAEILAAEARVKEREAEIPEAYRDRGRVAGELSEKGKELESAEAALQEARGREKEAGLALRSAEESDRQAREALHGAREEARQEEERWVERRSGAGFESDQAYGEAFLEAEAMESLQEEIRQYGEDRVRVEGELRKTEELTRDRVRPDVPALEEAEEAARKAADQLREAFTEAGSRLKGARDLKEELGEIAAESQKLDERYGVVGHLSEVANSRSMTFQRYVLAVYLDYVLRAASERLTRMSNGRYRLARRVVQADRRSHSGLDLDVEDSYTGKTRSVSTLSGGESFLSALSLAMGLAEIVQQFSGGVRLDTIFVDEGFGSLDPEALDQALNALVELRENGRTVGVISHVPELKERIDVRLDVHGSRTGSRAEFVVP
jgi:exonuclease SbcC